LCSDDAEDGTVIEEGSAEDWLVDPPTGTFENSFSAATRTHYKNNTTI